MRQSETSSSKLSLVLLAAMLGIAASAEAGPPLICHAILIGNAKALPWTDSSRNLGMDPSYDLKNLVPDTLEILTPSTPVLVRMETLRRATIYARQDPRTAKELLVRLYARANDADRAGQPNALAWFDAGYLVECYQQWIGRNLPHMTDGMPMDPNPAANLDGYAWVTRAIGLHGSDAQMEFAAALITLEGTHATDLHGHAERAQAGAKSDPLLAANLESHFIGNRGQTIAEMISSVTTAKN
ncbi:MAG TPA: hypothetical protein VGZ29_04040 [Terriglobia bacterium]|nr:hypothetical protein [Terriglobia bacterium]